MPRSESELVDQQVDEFLRSQEIREILDESEIDSFRSNLKLPAAPSTSFSQPSTSPAAGDVIATGSDGDVSQSEIDSILMPPPPGVRREGLLPRPSLASLGIPALDESIKECLKPEGEQNLIVNLKYHSL